MGLMTSRIISFRARSIQLAPKLSLSFTTAGWSAQPYSINFGNSSPLVISSPLLISANTDFMASQSLLRFPDTGGGGGGGGGAGAEAELAGDVKPTVPGK